MTHGNGAAAWPRAGAVAQLRNDVLEVGADVRAGGVR